LRPVSQYRPRKGCCYDRLNSPKPHANNVVKALPLLDLTLPWPPTVNTYWRYVPGFGPKISKGGRAYRKEVGWIVSAQRAGIRIKGKLKVEIQAMPPDLRQRDIDNLTKSLFDSLTHAHVWRDDSQIDDFRVIRRPPQKPGKVHISIWEL
jgi:crossover junction endodeoxyribonuclease RusA